MARIHCFPQEGRHKLKVRVIVQVLVGNKCDMGESKRVVPYSKGQALADEFGIQFFETSAKSNLKVEEVSSISAPPCFPSLVVQMSAHSYCLCPCFHRQEMQDYALSLLPKT